MDWMSRRATAVIENALTEDRATRDATTYACIDPHQRATATVIAKQECILAGVGVIMRTFEVFAQLDGTVVSHPEVTSHPEIFDGVRLRNRQQITIITHNTHKNHTNKHVILNVLQRMSGIATETRKY